MNNIVKRNTSTLCGQRSQEITSTWLCVLLAIAGHAWSDDYLFSPGVHQGFNDEQVIQMRIVPPHMMETATLFLAAEVERDTSMNVSQRLFNNRWLYNQGQADRSGAQGLREYLRLHLMQRWKTQRVPTQANQGSLRPITAQAKISPLQDLSNYQLRVSDDKIHLKFKYHFD